MVEVNKNTYVLTGNEFADLDISISSYGCVAWKFHSNFDKDDFDKIKLRLSMAGIKHLSYGEHLLIMFNSDDNEIEVCSDQQIAFADTVGRMFSMSALKSLDLKEVDARECKSFMSTFEGLACDVLDLSALDTSSLVSTKYMFSTADIGEIRFGDKFTLDNVEDASLMFYQLKTKQLDLSHTGFHNCKNFNGVFSELNVDRLDISDFKINLEDTYIGVGSMNQAKIGKLCIHHKIDDSKLNAGEVSFSNIVNAIINLWSITNGNEKGKIGSVEYL